ncbi:hypothetical protein [Streptomyces sp. NPDC001296]
MQKLDTRSPMAPVLGIPAGRVQFIAAERADTTVEVLPADASKGRDALHDRATHGLRLPGCRPLRC